MEKIRIILICGSGASSGFMAANMRKAAKDKGLDASIVARSEAELDNYIDEVDVVMIGPHLKYKVDEVNEVIEDYDIEVILMRSDYYATLNGEAAIDHLLEELKNK